MTLQQFFPYVSLTLRDWKTDLLTYLPLLATYLPFILIAAAGIVFLMLFSSLRSQLRRVRAEIRILEAKVSQQPVSQGSPAVPAGNEKAKTSVDREGTVFTSLPKTSLNTTNRSKALKLHKQGQSSEQIAAGLRLSRGEVELLVKVHQIEAASLSRAVST